MRNIEPTNLKPETKAPLKSFRDRAREQRQEITRDTNAFFKLSFLFLGAFFLLLFMPQTWMERIDNVNPLLAAIVTFWLFAIITIKLIVGKRKMW